MTPDRRARAEQVTEYRAGGMTFAEIAERVGVSTKQARDDFYEMIEQDRPDTARRVFAELSDDFTRLRTLAMRAAEDGHPGAIRDAVTVLEKTARLHGIWDQKITIGVDEQAMVMDQITAMFTVITDEDIEGVSGVDP